MSKTLPKASAATQPQSSAFFSDADCGGGAGTHVVNQLVLPSIVRRSELADDFRDVVKSVILADTTIQDFGEAIGVDKSTMSRRLNGRPNYGDIDPEVQAAIVEFRLPSGYKIGNWWAQHYDCRPLEPLRPVTAAEENAAFRAILDESGPLGDDIKRRVRARLGARR